MTRKILMHVGPVTIDVDVLKEGLRGDVGFTSREFVEAFQYSLKAMRRLFNAKPNDQPFIIPGGGTSAMESVTSLLRKGDKVLVVSNGVFGDRWEAILSRYPVTVKVLRAEPGDYVSPDIIEEELKREKYTAVTMTHVETSTGIREPIYEVAKRVRSLVDLIVVDGVSSVSAEETKLENIDVFLTASQKALGTPPGAGLLMLSENAVNRLGDDSVAGYYLNLKNWLPVMRSMEEGKGAYFATPPVHLILMLAKSFQLIEKEGLENRVKRHARISQAIRAGIEGMGLSIVAKRPEAYSNTVTGVLVKKVNPAQVLQEMNSNGIELAPGVHPALAGKYFRIGHMGWVNENDAIATIATLERVLYKLGEPVKLGEGLKATQLQLA
ncbi:MAG: alanine--glyoxylate aminotransferase family protein [Candidatus Aramenus sp.]|nr:alanine--glyoxylate aminotransferase family protein [Candidatus Aramenus sp.]